MSTGTVGLAVTTKKNITVKKTNVLKVKTMAVCCQNQY